MTVLSPSGLETIDYNAPGWNAIFNRDFELLNNVLLYVNRLADVSGTPTNHQILTWEASSSKFKPRSY